MCSGPDRGLTHRDARQPRIAKDDCIHVAAKPLGDDKRDAVAHSDRNLTGPRRVPLSANAPQITRRNSFMAGLQGLG